VQVRFMRHEGVPAEPQQTQTQQTMSQLPGGQGHELYDHIEKGKHLNHLEQP
jgi:hypothetical protein